MKILAVERPLPAPDPAAYTPALLEAEARRAWELYQAGTLRELYFRADRVEAVLLLECDSTEAAEAALATLPLVALLAGLLVVARAVQDDSSLRAGAVSACGCA